jgi:hypothetical protein
MPWAETVRRRPRSFAGTWVADLRSDHQRSGSTHLSTGDEIRLLTLPGASWQLFQQQFTWTVFARCLVEPLLFTDKSALVAQRLLKCAPLIVHNVPLQTSVFLEQLP